MLLFAFVGRITSSPEALGFGTMLIAHVTFSLPYVVLNVLPKLRQTDPHLAEAAQDLGSTPVQAFFRVVLPSIMPGIVSGALMALGLAYGDENNRECGKSAQLLEKFRGTFGTLRCGELVGTEKEERRAVCPAFIDWCSDYLEEEFK